ncbi:TIM44-like domain-containing protein [Sphingobium sp. SJ10-10]|uniref:Tim44 domain-containing protein n=1 Tax=Sphingobium sp. SJ10-10 TaxID=3114999 RepID=UPI002E195155|nr:TIM44-like domain-containing protein [Sphingobium sp. SJ10-10]
MIGTKYRNAGAIAMSLAVAVMVASPADARRGGSFGSRGSRTAVAPPATKTAPNQAPAVQRTTTQNQAPAQNSAAAARPAPNSPNRFGGLAKGLIGGLIAGGLLGMLLGNGFGALNGSGMLMALLQIALLAGLAWFAFKLFRRRPAMAAAGAMAPSGFTTNAFTGTSQGGFGGAAPPTAPAASVSWEIAITTSDQQSFERLLTEVQDAFGREDYARLRACTTPEIMSYLAEEMSQNATRGQRNEVSRTELLDADVAEAWTEDGTDYATIAMRYQSIDVMRDRNSGAVVKGDPDHPTTTTELWTFVRDGRSDWRLSAIQEA